jgi:hypothetical protein
VEEYSGTSKKQGCTRFSDEATKAVSKDKDWLLA